VVGIGRDITERRRRKKKLERQNDLFERAQEIANVGAWQFDVQSGEFTLTDQGYRVHGLDPDGDMTPERSHELFHPEDRPKADEAFRRAIEDGEPYDIEARLITEEGEERWVRTRGEPQQEDGEVVRIRGTIQDITERKERERRLAVTSQRLEAILKHTTRPMFVKNRDGEYLLTNRCFRELLGLEEGEVLGQTDEDLFPPEMTQAVRENDQTVLRDGESVEREERIQANGEWHTYLSAKAPLYDVGTEQDPDRPVALFGVATDITERKRRERRLRQAETMFQNAQDALFLIDMEGDHQGEGGTERTFSVRRVNPAYEEATGLSEEDIRGETPQDLLGGEAGRYAAEQYRTCVRQREPLAYEEEWPLDGEMTYWTTRIAPVVVEGEVRQIVGTTRDVTEQRRRKEKLERQNDLFEKAQEIAHVGAWEYDVQSEESTLTEQAYRIHGLAPASGMTPEKSLEFYHAEDRPTIRQAFTRAVEDGESYDLEARLTGEDGEERWVRTRGEPQREEGNPEGEVVRVRGTLRDITERKQREQALREAKEEAKAARELFETIFNNAPVMIDFFDADENLQMVNDHWESVLGWSEAEIKEHADPTEVLYPVPEERQDSLEFMEEAPDEWRDFRFRTKSGEVLDTTWTNAELSDGRRIGIGLDITDRKERERVLRERQDKVEALYEGTNQLLRSEDKEAVGSCLVSLIDETFDFAGTAVRYVEGNPEEGDLEEEGQLVPVKLSDPLQAHMPERLPYDLEGDSPVAEAYRSGQAQVYDDLRDVESAVNRGDVRAAAYVPMGSHGTLSVGSLEAGGIEDFDRRLIEVLAGYAALVLDRLEREEALLAAKEEAEKASRMKSSFLANVSHEVRTPLTSIIGFAEALGTEASELDLPEGVALPKYANLIEQGGKRLLETLEGVLNLSKLEAGQMDLGEGPVDLATEVQRTVDELRSKAREKDIGLQVQTERAEAGADKGGVQIVARNLLSNAVKYTEQEGTVWLRTYREEGWAVLEVEDTGIGMEPEATDRLFEPFRQASEGFNRKYEGTGVGLAVVDMAIEQMGGTLECETEKGEGSRFTVRLPTEHAEADSKGPQQEA
jgi:PAS domain S-box-containing protein